MGTILVPIFEESMERDLNDLQRSTTLLSDKY